jgi:hypothetical protein
MKPRHFSFGSGLAAIITLLALLAVIALLYYLAGNRSATRLSPPALAADSVAPPATADSRFSYESLKCEQVNAADASGTKNPFLAAAWDAERESYSYAQAIDLFLEGQNEHFSSYIETLSGTDLKCGLSRDDVPSAMADQRVQPLPLFAADRLTELRQIDCALQEMSITGRLICPLSPDSGRLSRLEVFNCEERMRKEITRARADLKMATQVALIQLDEMAIAWPIHKRLECLNENMIDLRKQMVEFLGVFAKLPPALINAAQSR